MTIVSHKHRFILLRTRKTAGSSVEAALLKHVGPEDWLSVTRDLGRVDHPFSRAANQTTGWVPQEMRVKRLLGRQTPFFPAWGLHMHAPAAAVKEAVGEQRWGDYLKISIERNPWDRMLSLWRWRNPNGETSFDEFLAAIEYGHWEALAAANATDWSNWPIYAIGDQVVADVVVQQSDLIAGLSGALRRVGIAWDGDLPRLKGQVRGGGHGVATLTAEQVERIRRLFRREIEAFGYVPPVIA